MRFLRARWFFGAMAGILLTAVAGGDASRTMKRRFTCTKSAPTVPDCGN